MTHTKNKVRTVTQVDVAKAADLVSATKSNLKEYRIGENCIISVSIA